MDQLVARVMPLVDSFSKSTLSRIENGQQGYTQETLEALAQALECRPTDLLIQDPLKPNDPWSLWVGMGQEGREAILRKLASVDTGGIFGYSDGDEERLPLASEQDNKGERKSR